MMVNGRGFNAAPRGKAAEMFLLRYSREAEHESDTLGVNYRSPLRFLLS
jgi:hypothetical protein